MTKKEAMRRTMQDDTLRALGFTQQEAEQLRRISMTLQRWHELECGIDGGRIERDGDEDDSRPYLVRQDYRTGKVYRRAIPDRETGARKRLAKIIKARNGRMPERSVVMLQHRAAPDLLSAYIQTDPRGAALYIIRPGDVPEGGDVSAYYSRGICVY